MNVCTWLPVHIRDMLLLSEKNPAIFARQVCRAQRSNKFSAMAIDLCHKQNNAIVKESVVGLTSNPGAMRRWMVADPEITRIIM